MAEIKYPDKSMNGNTPEKKPEVPVPELKGEVINNKKSKLKRAFISEDIIDVKDYVFMDVFIPALKKLIVDIFYNGLNALFYGSSANRTRPGGSQVSFLQYDKMSQGAGAHVVKPYQTRSSYNYTPVKFTNAKDAELILDLMDECLERYGYVSVADLYQRIKKTPSSVDYNWGWTDLKSAHVMYDNNGWVIDLPRAVPLKK